MASTASNVGLYISPKSGDVYVNGLCTIVASNASASVPAARLTQNHTGHFIEAIDEGIQRLVMDGNGNIGIGTSQPRSTLDMWANTGGLRLPHANYSQRPAATSNIPCQLRFNNYYNTFETANSVSWSRLDSTIGYPVANMVLDWDAANTLSYPGTGNTVDSLAYPNPNVQGTLTNVTYASSAFVFNGVNSSIEGTLNNPQGAWAHSISFWMQLNADQSTYSSRIDPFQIGNINTFSSYSAMDIYNGGFNWYFYNNDTNYTGNIFKANTWYHIVLTYNGGSADTNNKRCYINNVEYLLEGGTGTALDMEANAMVAVGRDRGRQTAYFPGKIARFQVFNGALTPTEIGSLYYMTNKSMQMPVWYLPGMIIQKIVKRVYSAVHIGTTSANNFDTQIFVNITPRYATSKIRITLETSMSYSTGGQVAILILQRNGIEVTPSVYGLTYQGTTLTNWYYPSMRTFIDEPMTTTPLSYRVYIRSGTIRVVHDYSNYHIIAEEIAQ